MKIESVKVKGWTDRVFGVVLKENDDWLLIRHIQLNYLIDGLILIKKKYIRKRQRSIQEEIMEKSIQWKDEYNEFPSDLIFGSTLDLLTWVEQYSGIIHFQDGKKAPFTSGFIYKIKPKKIQLDLLKEDGTLFEAYNFKFLLKDIRVIAINSAEVKAKEQLAKNSFCKLIISK